MFEAIDRFHPTIFFGVPTLYAAMLQVEGAATRFDLSSLRFCVSAGEALPPDIFRRWRERFELEIVDGIGSTEMSTSFSRIVPARAYRYLGRRSAGHSARIVDDGDGVPLPAGGIGTLMARGEVLPPATGSSMRRRRRPFKAIG